MTLSLRTGLIVWFTGLASVVIGASAVVLHGVTRGMLLDGVDAMLATQAEGIGALCEWESGRVELEGYFEAGGPKPLLQGDSGFEVRVQPSGQIQVRRGVELPPPRPGHEVGAETYGSLRVTTMTVTFPPRPAASEPHPEPSSPGFTVVVRTAASLLPIERQVATIRSFSFWTAALSTVVVAMFGWFLSRRVTGPLARLGEAATRVRDGAVADLPRTGNGDEIDRLTVLFGEAFAAVRGAVEQQKRFVADASHELRNPVATIASIAEIGQRRVRGVDEYGEMLASIETVARRMTGILQSLLALARLDATGRMHGPTVDLADMVREIAGGVTTAAHIALDTSPSLVAGDPQLLRMLCSNLLDNAAKHAASRVEVRVARVDGNVTMRIVDDGPGLSAPERERAFERFFRGGEAKGSGAGLGLALVRSIVRAHGGDCRIEPDAGGLHVLVTLPVANDKLAARTG